MTSSISINDPQPQSPTIVVPDNLAMAAYDRVEPELDAVEPRDLVRMNVDVPAAVNIAVGALPRMRVFRDQIQKELSSFDLSVFDKLEDYALAAWFAHLRAQPLSGPDSPIQALLLDAGPLRERLLAAAESLVQFGLLDAKQVATLRGGSGHIDLANDLLGLAGIFRDHWAAIHGKTPATEHDVTRAAEIGQALFKAVGARNQVTSEPLVAPTADRRARAFTLFVRSYDACRRAIAYLRWAEDDVDLIAPSIFKKRARRADPKSEGPESAPVLPAPVEPTPAPVVTGGTD